MSLVQEPLMSIIHDEIAARWPCAATTAVVLLTGFVLRRLLAPDTLAGIPIVGEGSAEQRRKFFISGRSKELYYEGKKKIFGSGGAVFRMTTIRKMDSLVISEKYAKEMGKLPDDTLSFEQAFNDAMQDKYIHMHGDFELVPRLITTALNPALGRLNSILHNEVVEAMRLELPQSASWTPVTINKPMHRVVAMAAGRIFIGPELCRDEAYLESAINYTMDVMVAVHIIQFMPAWLRPFAAPWLPQNRKLQQRRRDLADLIKPVVAARKEAARTNHDYQEPDDMLQWVINDMAKKGKGDVTSLAHHQLTITGAALHTTTMAATHAFFTLAAMPELIPMLREDVQQSLAASKGEFTNQAMQSMRKLDSFMKENLRYYPLASSSFQRKVLKPFTLSNGQYIPAGAFIELPGILTVQDEQYYPEPEKFDALRFYDKDVNPSASANAQQFVGVSNSSLTWGYGRHACPGRFLANNELKMILAHALINYDWKLPDGVTERYPDRIYSSAMVPEPNGVILMKRL